MCWFWSVIDGPSGAVIVGLTFAQYIAAPFYPGCYASQLLIKLVCFLSVMALSIINGMSVKVMDHNINKQPEYLHLNFLAINLFDFKKNKMIFSKLQMLFK